MPTREQEVTPPKTVQLETETPKPASAVTERLRILFYFFAALILFALIYGFYSRSHQKQQKQQAQAQATVASQAAPSSRAVIDKTADPAAGGPRPGSHPVSDAYNQENETHTGSTPAITHPPVGYQSNSYPDAAANAAGSLSALQQAAWQREEDRRKDLLARRQAPIAGSTPTGGGAGSTAAPPEAANVLATLAHLTQTAPSSPALPPPLLPGSLPPTYPAPGAALAAARLLPSDSSLTSAEYQAQNAQAEKQNFAQENPSGTPVMATRVDPVSPYMLMQGTHIPVSLDPLLQSDLPGEVTALVRRNVHDTRTGRYVLIPAGTKVLGSYNSNITYGQQNVQVAWTRLIYPDDTSQEIGRMLAYSANGASGLHDQVDNHYKRLIGGLALTSLLSAGLQISQGRNSQSVLTYPSTGQEIGAAVGQQATQLGQRLTDRNLNVQPTLKIRPGAVFYVSVNKDLAFREPYVAHKPPSGPDAQHLLRPLSPPVSDGGRGALPQ